MANPQKENGYTAIANEILEHITKLNLNGTQFRIVLLIWRYTYGYHKTEREMSLALIAEGIGTTRNHVDRELKALIDRNIVNVSGVGKGRGRLLSVNKNYDQWQEDKTVKQAPAAKKKKPSKPRKTKVYEEDSTYYKMAVYYMGLVKEVAKEVGLEHLIANSNLQTWADDFRKLIEINKVDKKQVYLVMNWVVKDSFWRHNVLSAKKFRDKYLELVLKMNKQNNPKQNTYSKPVPVDTRDREIAFNRFVADGGNPEDFEWPGDF